MFACVGGWEKKGIFEVLEGLGGLKNRPVDPEHETGGGRS